MTETIKMRVKRKMAYLVEMSNKTKIQIDVEELPQILEAIKNGSIVKVRQGFFNPAFFVDIIKDEERTYSIERGIDNEISALQDIFDGYKLIAGADGIKKLLNVKNET